MSRLVVFSNRLPVGDNPSGGLVVALARTMEEKGGLWIGTAGDPQITEQDSLSPHEGAAFERLSMTLSPYEYHNYYCGYANSVLWPLFHGRPDLLDVRPEYFRAFQRTNQRLAKLSAPKIKADDIIWIHDYHLIPLACELRARGIKNKIGFFLHTPFPSSAHAHILSHFEQIAEWMAYYDLVGLQTNRDVASALDSFRGLPNAEILMNGRIKINQRVVKLASFPISINCENFQQLAERENPEGLNSLPSNHQRVIGVDRLDYSKGLPQRLRGFQRYLRENEPNGTRTTLLQIAPPTRESVNAYVQIRKELESLSGEINGAYGQVDYTPVQYIHRSLPRSELAGLFRGSRVGLVTPLLDGMNLVAKEYVAAQNPDDPGVLVLSKFAGAHEQLKTGAISVNPYDAVSIAEGISEAFSMERKERIERYNRMMKIMRDRDIHWWTRTFLQVLQGQPISTPIEKTPRLATV